ncbi:MAG TPA: hypothetical protein VLM40_18000, partial [Gemmata sp.]|nr:hypothetical protein [Gemmata sp.]
LSELERDGDELGRTFISVVHDGPHMIPWAYATMINPDAYLDFWKGVRLLAMYPLWGELPRGLVPIINEVPKIALMSLSISPKYVGYRWESFFRLPGGLPASADQEKTFAAIWKAAGILPSGQAKGGLLPNNETIDPHASIALKDNAVEVRVPCEMSALAPGGGFAYRARVVLSCTEPDVIAELKRLRASADPDSGTVPQPADFRKRHFKWQVVGIESDLARVSTSKMEQMAMEGAPPPGGK